MAEFVKTINKHREEVWHPKPPLATLGVSSFYYGGLWDPQKPNKNRTYKKIFDVVKITTYIFTPVFGLFLALFIKKLLHIFWKCTILEVALGEAR